ncbi:MAG: divalent-cation tolerance protein CutA [Rhodobacteraceae bacterium]|nr:divalent-cation tolerance protein CutA [Paracoccaceae bacterium]
MDAEGPGADEVVEVEVSCPDTGVATAIARAMIAGRLAACANVGAPVLSLYRWQGRLVEEGEVMVRLKTRAALLAPLAAAIRAAHPYALPAILAWRLRATADYAAWVAAETGDAGPPPGDQKPATTPTRTSP